MSDEDNIGELVNLNESLLREFTCKIESAINEVFVEPDQNPFVELLAVLISFAVQISIDIDVPADDLFKFITDIYEEALLYTDDNDEIQDEITCDLLKHMTKNTVN